MCIVCLACLFVGCKSVNNEPEITSSNTKVEKTLVWQEDVPGVFSVAKCEFNSDKSAIMIQLRNDSDKIMTSFVLLVQFFDKNNKIIEEDEFSDDYSFSAEPGELTHESGRSINDVSSASRVGVFVTSVSYRNESSWVNENIGQRLRALNAQSVDNVYQIIYSNIDKYHIQLQTKNLSTDKTIESYDARVHYIENGIENKRTDLIYTYDEVPVAPDEDSKLSQWKVSAKNEGATIYITNIVYSDGTKWNNPNIPPQ